MGVLKFGHLGDRPEITSYATNWRRKSFDVVHEVSNGGDLCAEGYETRVCARYRENDSDEFLAISIPEEIRQRFRDPD
jgi:acyl-CoA thioesterase FadM